ncbi:MAG: DNA polymerase III subunit delta [Patescibacteria group bacterium]|nr:DNA polymerase III subunit delta [Patescibacteria group bacterium]
MLFFYYGEDNFRAREKALAIAAKFKEKIDPSGQNVCYLDGENLTAADFFPAVSSAGFLAEKKLIIIKNIFANKKLTNWQDDLLTFLKKQKNSVEENYLIFLQDSKPDKRSKLYKTLSALKFAEEFNPLSPLELKKWISNRLEKQNKKISPDALSLLVAFVGSDLWQMSQEIDKLVNYTDKEINSDDIKKIVQAKIDDNIFSLIDALGKKDKALALKLLEEKLDYGTSPQYILAMIARQYRLLIKTKELTGQIKYSGALIQVLKIPKFAADKALEQSRLYQADELKKIYGQLLELDEKFKSGQGQEKILFAKMINQL